MNKFEKCLKSIDGNSDNKYDNINVNEMMSDINTVLRDGRNNVDDNGGLVLIALQIAQWFLKDKKHDIQQELEEGRFIDELFKYYSFIQSDQITDDFTVVLIYLLDTLSIAQKLKMKQEKYIAPLIHLLDCNDEDCLAHILWYLSDIATQMDQSGERQQQNQIRSVFEKIEALPQLLKIMKNENFEDEDINSYAAAIIGSTYKASKLPDEFRRIVIEYLKLAAQHEDQYFIRLSALVLAGLAECVDNHSDIVAEIIPYTLSQYINEDEYNAVDQGMMLAINLFRYGIDETIEKVIEAVPQERVAEWAEQNEDQDGLIEVRIKPTSQQKLCNELSKTVSDYSQIFQTLSNYDSSKDIMKSAQAMADKERFINDNLTQARSVNSNLLAMKTALDSSYEILQSKSNSSPSTK
ncbi:MAG: hypothetical protein EZS28_025412 [Streblomastix strix]|uniref:Uncharacterized protein n=1 Tax=Streblomastix strix TaxID=222440 RepID=A0A5J4V9B5_9EUKA|nr:MAG: hypothetical protein EZS28_025412 [Streblomastix strix]